jgi:hypothetical protein
MFEILFPIPFLLLGLLMTFKRERFAEWFCAIGKATWRINTLGLTDMAPFYREEKAKRTFKILGPLFLCIGLLLCGWTFLSFSGPGSFCAMRESRAYLKSRYGYSTTWKESSSFAGVDDSVDLSYQYGEHSGKLHGMWQKDHYVFTEIPATPSSSR